MEGVKKGSYVQVLDAEDGMYWDAVVREINAKESLLTVWIPLCKLKMTYHFDYVRKPEEERPLQRDSVFKRAELRRLVRKRKVCYKSEDQLLIDEVKVNDPFAAFFVLKSGEEVVYERIVEIKEQSDDDEEDDDDSNSKLKKTNVRRKPEMDVRMKPETDVRRKPSANKRAKTITDGTKILNKYSNASRNNGSNRLKNARKRQIEQTEESPKRKSSATSDSSKESTNEDETKEQRNNVNEDDEQRISTQQSTSEVVSDTEDDEAGKEVVQSGIVSSGSQTEFPLELGMLSTTQLPENISDSTEKSSPAQIQIQTGPVIELDKDGSTIIPESVPSQFLDQAGFLLPTFNADTTNQTLSRDIITENGPMVNLDFGTTSTSIYYTSTNCNNMYTTTSTFQTSPSKVLPSVAPSLTYPSSLRDAALNYLPYSLSDSFPQVLNNNNNGGMGDLGVSAQLARMNDLLEKILFENKEKSVMMRQQVELMHHSLKSQDLMISQLSRVVQAIEVVPVIEQSINAVQAAQDQGVLNATPPTPPSPSENGMNEYVKVNGNADVGLSA